MSPQSKMRHTLRLAATTLLLWLLLAAPVRGGTYNVLACDAAGGVNNSWTTFVNSAALTAYAACPSGGDRRRGLLARNAVAANTSISSGSVARMDFWAPAGTAIVGVHAAYRFYRAGPEWEAALSTGSQVVAGCGAGGVSVCDVSSPNAYIPVPGSNVIYIDAFCAFGSCPVSSTGDPAHDYLQATANLYSATVVLQDDSAPGQSNPRGALWTNAWQGGTQSLAIDASDNAGVQENRFLMDGTVVVDARRNCDFTLTIPCPQGGAAVSIDTRTIRPDGAHTLVIQSIDPAGNVAQVSRPVLIDNTPPGPPQQLQLDGGGGWRTSNSFTVRWQNPPQPGTAPITGAGYQLCPVAGGACRQGSRDGASITALPDLTVPAVGDYTLRVWLRDAAGNSDQSTSGDPVHLRFDDQPPDARFRAPDPSDPTKIAVRVHDVGGGTAGGSIEYKSARGTAWRAMPSDLRGDDLIARIDDQHLRNGVYDLRATAVDQAGNQRATDRTADGGAASITLPVRLKTRLVVGARGRHRSSRRARRLRSRVRIQIGHRIRLYGRLTSADRSPVAQTEVQVLQRLNQPGAGWTPLARLQTSRTGRFSYLVRRGVSRTIRFRYPGTANVRAADRDVVVRVAARTTLHVNHHRAIVGQTVRFHGRVRGGHLPASGKLVELQVHVRGRWRTFVTTRAHRRGRWHYDYRFDGTSGRVTYRFRARVPHEATYPYASGASRPTKVVVRGL